jgi:hypothetical protein
MARRPKQPDPHAEGGTAVADPPSDANGTYAQPSASEQPPPATVGDAPPQPAKRFSLPVCDGVRIEGCLWPREVVIDGKTTTAYSATVRKAVRGEDEAIRHSTSFRGAEIPIVQYVLGCCAQWMLDQRREEDPPF